MRQSDHCDRMMSRRFGALATRVSRRSCGQYVVHEHDGKKVVFCCKGCTKKFNSDPAKYLKKVEDAAAAKK